MPDTFKPLSEVLWVEKLVAGRYKVKVPSWMVTEHDWWPDWEVARFRSMEENLKKGDILFDVGSETGWISAIYAQFVGAENMCLFEPTPELWPAIKATWQQNGLDVPRATCPALVSDTSREYVDNPMVGGLRSWPILAYGEMLLENVKYNHINEDSDRRPQITLDRFVQITGIEPRAITIDVEGAEYQVLWGAQETIRRCRPLVWVSIHEQFMVDRYKVWPATLRLLMESCGYQPNFLAEDHEGHWFFQPK